MPIFESLAQSRAPVTVAILPARSGSKRIPRKNIRSFRGRPLITWTIETLIQSNAFSHVVVSTDDDEIADIAEKSGAAVPFRRPDSLSDDYTVTKDVVAHALTKLESILGYKVQLACCAYPAGVFVTPDDISLGLETLLRDTSRIVMTAGRYSSPIQRAWKLDSNGDATMIWPKHQYTRTQDLAEAYYDAGQFYWATRDWWKSPDDGNGDRRGMVVLPPWKAQDIDTDEDWQFAEMLHETAFG